MSQINLIASLALSLSAAVATASANEKAVADPDVRPARFGELMKLAVAQTPIVGHESARFEMRLIALRVGRPSSAARSAALIDVWEETDERAGKEAAEKRRVRLRPGATEHIYLPRQAVTISLAGREFAADRVVVEVLQTGRRRTLR